MDTIFAPATVTGRAGVAVIKISGSRAWDGAKRLCGSLPPARTTALRKIRSTTGELIDIGLVLPFSRGGSFTGEDVVEFQLHGSVAVVNAVLRELGQLDGFRLAEPGEFTRRALENDCLDLSQVEGLADLIDAETERQREQAVRSLAGELGRRADEWRSLLIRAMSLVEVSIDFADEDVPQEVGDEVHSLIGTVQTQLETELERSSMAERIRDGFEVAIVGRPNVGKSTLLNALAGRDAAIISEYEGTTRDIIEVRMDLGGIPVTFLDTAGLREAADPVERIGIERSRARAESSDLKVFLVEELSEDLLVEKSPGDIVVLGKADLRGGDSPMVSGVTGTGVKQLLDDVASVLEQRSGSAAVLTRERQRVSVQNAIEALSRVSAGGDGGRLPAEVISEELRMAVASLDSLVGKIDVEMILDEIFQGFCIGK